MEEEDDDFYGNGVKQEGAADEPREDDESEEMEEDSDSDIEIKLESDKPARSEDAGYVAYTLSRQTPILTKPQTSFQKRRSEAGTARNIITALRTSSDQSQSLINTPASKHSQRRSRNNSPPTTRPHLPRSTHLDSRH